MLQGVCRRSLVPRTSPRTYETEQVTYDARVRIDSVHTTVQMHNHLNSVSESDAMSAAHQNS